MGHDVKPTYATDAAELHLHLVFDAHLGHVKCVSERWRAQVDDIRKDRCAVWLDGGDLMEAATRESPGEALVQQPQTLDECMDIAEEVYAPITHKCLGFHPGNHELRLYKFGGINPTKQMARRLDVPYLGAGHFHRIAVRDELYTLYTTHGFGAAATPLGKMSAVMRLETMMQSEIYAIGHLHMLAWSQWRFSDFDASSKPHDRPTTFILCGSYLSYWDSYAHAKGWRPSMLGSPILHLSGTSHDVRVSA